MTSMQPTPFPHRRILVVGDTHASLSWVQVWFPGQLERWRPDVVIVAGDFGFWPHTGDGCAFLAQLETVCANHDVEVWFVDGNHEHHDALAGLERAADGRAQVSGHVWYLPRGYRWSFDGRVWLAAGGAVSVDRYARTPHVDWFPDEVLSAGQVRAIGEAGRADVVVAHDAPPGIGPLDAMLQLSEKLWRRELIEAGQRHRETVGSLCDAVAPSVWFHGHYHVRYSHTAGGVRFEGLSLSDHPVGHAVLVGADGAVLNE